MFDAFNYILLQAAFVTRCANLEYKNHGHEVCIYIVEVMMMTKTTTRLLLLAANTHGATTVAGGLGVLATNAHAPVVTQTTMCPVERVVLTCRKCTNHVLLCEECR